MSEEEKYNRIIDELRRIAAEILPKGSRVGRNGSRARGDAREDSAWELQVLNP